MRDIFVVMARSKNAPKCRDHLERQKKPAVVDGAQFQHVFGALFIVDTNVAKNKVHSSLRNLLATWSPYLGAG